ncbi:glycosyltransferase family 2 protein [Fibrobacter sp. UWH1]|uniref:glycosyltransferase family 2 protein n=1 Tax=Fibrobacter sp. UWH1 TaxID=1964354 RepID=UPI0015950954|nr:glycosyltransferase family 2 protein [Fibrobacter sp. UWH1]
MSSNFDEKKISVIIPAYNVEKYLLQCVKSVSNQTYKNLEIIVVDDGSKDSTLEIAQNLRNEDERIVVIHKENGGLSSARNAGMNIATGDYVLFLDSDDWFESNACEVAISVAETNHADIVLFDYYREFEHEQVQYCAHKGDVLKYEKNGKREFFLYDMKTITAWGKLYSRKILCELRFDEKMRTAEDVEFNYRVFSNVESAVYIRQCLLHYRMLPQSAIHGFDPKIGEKFEYPLEKTKELISSQNTDSLFAYYSFAAIAYLVSCQNQICRNSKLGLFEKTKQIRDFSKKIWVKDLFFNMQNVTIPFSRKMLVHLGRLRCFGILSVIISLKCLRKA